MTSFFANSQRYDTILRLVSVSSEDTLERYQKDTYIRKNINLSEIDLFLIEGQTKVGL